MGHTQIEAAATKLGLPQRVRLPQVLKFCYLERLLQLVGAEILGFEVVDLWTVDYFSVKVQVDDFSAQPDHH